MSDEWVNEIEVFDKKGVQAFGQPDLLDNAINVTKAECSQCYILGGITSLVLVY